MTSVATLIAQQSQSVDNVASQAQSYLTGLLDITNVDFSNGFNIDNLRQVVDTARLGVDLYRADIESNRNLTDGLVARNTLQAKVLDATVQQNIQISQVAIANAKAKLLAAVEALKFKSAGKQFASDKFYAILTAMVNTVNTLAVQSQTE